MYKFISSSNVGILAGNNVVINVVVKSPMNDTAKCNKYNNSNRPTTPFVFLIITG